MTYFYGQFFIVRKRIYIYLISNVKCLYQSEQVQNIKSTKTTEIGTLSFVNKSPGAFLHDAISRNLIGPCNCKGFHENTNISKTQKCHRQSLEKPRKFTLNSHCSDICDLL